MDRSARTLGRLGTTTRPTPWDPSARSSMPAAQCSSPRATSPTAMCSRASGLVRAARLCRQMGPTLPACSTCVPATTTPGLGVSLPGIPRGGDYSDPLSLNRWAYLQGNPVRYTDPSGHIPSECRTGELDPTHPRCSRPTSKGGTGGGDLGSVWVGPKSINLILILDDFWDYLLNLKGLGCVGASPKGGGSSNFQPENIYEVIDYYV